MIAVLGRAAARAFDRRAMDEGHVPGLLLMENAGRGAADVVERVARVRAAAPRVAVLAGSGGNGGDGYAVARHLVARGLRVTVLSSVDPDTLTGDARVMADAWRGIGGDVTVQDRDAGSELDIVLAESDVVVDALFGIGLTRPLALDAQALIDRVNAADVVRVALDLPSGLDADTGAAQGAVIQAHHTVTFAHPKLGLYTTAGAAAAGVVHVVDLGVPASPLPGDGPGAWLVTPRDAAELLRPRSLAAHKGSAGRVLVIAGSRGKTGAALLAARGAHRAGAGLVTIATWPAVADAIEARVGESMTARIDPGAPEASLDALLATASVAVVGPGLGLGPEARKVVEHVVHGWRGVAVLDADALTHYSGRVHELARAAGPRVLTPHPGELARLLASSIQDVEGDRFAAIARTVELSRCNVLLKGPRTLVAGPGEVPRVNVSGSPVLASGGSGDVLAGILAAFACELVALDAAVLAAYVHGRAGELWAVDHGADRGALASEIADRVPRVLAELSPVARA